jgi:PAS domain S-box-containing protein
MRTIGVRLLFAFICVIFFLIVEGVYAYYNAQRQASIQREALLQEIGFQKIKDRVQGLRLLVFEFLGTLDPYRMDDLKKRIEEELEIYTRLLAEAGVEPGQVNKSRDTYYRIAELHYQFSSNTARSLLNTRSNKQHNLIIKEIETKIEATRAAAVSRVDSEHQYSVLITLVLLGAALATSIGWAVVLGLSLTDRKKAEESLRQSEEDLRTTLLSIGDAVIATDSRGVIKRINPVAELLTGWSSAEAVGSLLGDVFKVVSATTGEELEDPLSEVLGRRGLGTVSDDTVLIARDGLRRRIADSAAPIVGKDGEMRGVVIVFRDVTELRRLEEKLQHAQKMETVGQLAGGIAHDFNNLLAGIMGFVDLLNLQLAHDSAVTRYIEGIRQAALRAAQLVQRLLAYSRKAGVANVSVEMKSLVQSVIDMIQTTVDKKIEIQNFFGCESCYVQGDPSQLQSAVLNLAINARDAMPDGGSMTFAVSEWNVGPEGFYVGQDELPPGRYLRVVVTDTGVGIPKHLQQKIFEPFFTTKEVGQGSGLGLAAVYGTAKQHGGAVSVVSEEGKGTSASIYLPLAEECVKIDAPEQAALVQGEGCILIVDDEEMIRDIGKALLAKLGFEVLLAEDGEAAISLYREKQERVKIVILDVVMPKLSGLETFRMLKAINPNVRVIVSSGFGPDQRIASILNEGAKGFLQKPFSIKDLSTMIAEAFSS